MGDLIMPIRRIPLDQVYCCQQADDYPSTLTIGNFCLILFTDTYMLAVMASGLFLHQYCKVQHLAGRTNVASPGSRLRQGPCAIHTTSAVEMFLLGYGKVLAARSSATSAAFILSNLQSLGAL